MNINIEIDNDKIRQIIVDYLSKQLGDLAPEPKDIVIEVKSKQNYRAEWEPAAFRAVYRKTTT